LKKLAIAVLNFCNTELFLAVRLRKLVRDGAARSAIRHPATLAPFFSFANIDIHFSPVRRARIDLF